MKPQYKGFLLAVPILTGLATAPGAVQLTNPASQPNQVLLSQSCQGSNAWFFERASETVTNSISDCGFQSLYTMIMAADRQAVGGSTSVNDLCTHTVSFNVDSPLPWKVRIRSQRQGKLFIRNEIGKCARAKMSRITVTASGPVTSTAGLNTSVDYENNTCNTGGDASPVSIADDNEVVWNGTGQGTVSLTFTWSATAYSNGNAFGGDEAIVRLGRGPNGLPTGCPGIIDFSKSPDAGEGHLVTVTLIDAVPSINIQSASVTCQLNCPPPTNCLYTTTGTVNCLENNYLVCLDYRDFNGALICTDCFTVTNGQHLWSHTSSCRPPVAPGATVTATVTDLLGLSAELRPISVTRTLMTFGGCPFPPTWFDELPFALVAAQVGAAIFLP